MVHGYTLLLAIEAGKDAQSHVTFHFLPDTCGMPSVGQGLIQGQETEPGSCITPSAFAPGNSILITVNEVFVEQVENGANTKAGIF